MRAVDHRGLGRLRLRQLQGAISVTTGTPCCRGIFGRRNVATRSVRALSSVQGVPFAAGASVHTCCPFKLMTNGVRESNMHVRSSDKAAKGPAIVMRSRRSLSS